VSGCVEGQRTKLFILSVSPLPSFLKFSSIHIFSQEFFSFVTIIKTSIFHTRKREKSFDRNCFFLVFLKRNRKKKVRWWGDIEEWNFGDCRWSVETIVTSEKNVSKRVETKRIKTHTKMPFSSSFDRPKWLTSKSRRKNSSTRSVRNRLNRNDCDCPVSKEPERFFLFSTFKNRFRRVAVVVIPRWTVARRVFPRRWPDGTVS